MKKIIILIFLFCNGILLMQAQNSYNPAMPDVIPPSPTSRIFQKFLGYPISHATGTIDINIPLYTLETNGLSIPLVLKYHSSGVRVQDPVGPVGRNWALFPGFKISRTIMSKPDEIYPVTDKGNYPSIEDQIYLASPYSNDCDCWNSFGRIYPRIDGQYDIFQIDIPGKTASFILQRINGVDVIKQIPETSLKITPKLDSSTNWINTRLYGFEVQDDNGIRYVFGETSPVHTSTSSNYLEWQMTGGCFCGWMLREIIFPNNTKISFTYQYVRDSFPAFNNNLTVLDDGKKVGIAGCYSNDMIDSSTGSNSPYWRFLGSQGYKIVRGNEPPYTRTNNSLMPTTITSTSATINFEYNNSDKLTSISVKRNATEQVKRIEFSYDDSSTKKLLKKINMTGEGAYQFNYKNEGIVKDSGFDWWGLYNGQPYSSTNLPNIDLSVNITTGVNESISKMSIGDNANRQPNAAYMDTHSLIEIIYPTKGALKISYEPHSYIVKGVGKIGGGLRVKSTESYDPVSNKRVLKNYTYEKPTFLSIDYPDQQSSVTNRYICPLDDGTCTVRQRTLSVFSNYPHIRGNTVPVWYGKITETANDWKKVYSYNYITDKYDNTSPEDFFINLEYFISEVNRILYSTPSLLSETSYKKSGGNYTKVESILNTYESKTSSLKGTVAIPYKFPMNGYSNCQFLEKMQGCHNNPYYAVYGSPIKYFPYYIETGSHHLATSQKITYQDNDSIVEKVTYAYDSQRPYNISSKITTLSGGSELVEKYYYSNNTIPDRNSLTSTQQSAIANLTEKNYLTTPVQQTLEKDGIQLYSILRGYKVGGPLMAMELENKYTRKGNNPFSNRITYHRYDSYHNPIYISKDDQEDIVYLWGYNGQYPVAEIKGATYTEVKNALGIFPEDLSSMTNPNMSTINGLRNKLPKALITTYTYSPLIGISTIGAPNGATTTFEYNSDGKLLRIKDPNGKTVEEYQYNFRP